MATNLQKLIQLLSDSEAEMLTGGLSQVGEEAATFSRERNNRGGNTIVQAFPGERSRWSSLPLNELARQSSDLQSTSEAFGVA